MAAGKDPDWQGNSNLKDCNKHLLENELYTDVEFQVGDEGTLIKAHKLMLAKRSPVFERMLYGPMAETKYPIVISDIEPEAFRALLRYCYCDELRMDRDITLSTLHAAKKYMLPFLEDHCRAILIGSLQRSNDFWEVYTSSIMLHDEKLLSTCRKFFGISIQEVGEEFEKPNFLNIPQCVLLDMLQLNSKDYNRTEGDEILLGEIRIFKACNAWAEAECLRQELEPTGENKRAVLGNCLYLIRFMFMLPEDLVNIVFATDILTQDERYALLEYGHVGYSCQVAFALRKFLYRKHLYLIIIQHPKCCWSIKEYSGHRRKEVEYGCIQLTPNSGLVISGIVCLNNNLTDAQTVHEVIIKKRGTETPWSKSFTVYSRDLIHEKLKKRRVKYLLFEELHLEKRCDYEIKVEKVGGKCNGENCKMPKIPTFSHKAKDPVQVDVEITEDFTNDCIIFLLARLV